MRFPSKITSPCVIFDILSGNNLIIDLFNIDLPQPDSPTTPKTSPFSNLKLTLSTVGYHCLFINKDVSSSLTSKDDSSSYPPLK